MREIRYRLMPGWRSSDFFCRVHFLAAVSTASIMSSAMLRGRGDFFSFLLIGRLRIIGQDDRALSTIRILNVGGCEMHGADHCAGVGAHFRQSGFQPLAG